MQFIIKTAPEELRSAQACWQNLEMQWKMAYNEAVFGKGAVLEPPKDDELMILLVRADTLRFAGPGARNPNMSTNLTNLSGLVPLYHLTYLSISNTRITSLKELVRHTQLRHLFVYENHLESLEGIEGMVHLKDLYAQHNKIKDLAPLKKLTNIETLYVSRNDLSSLDGITEKHADTMRKLYVRPNDNLTDREIIKFQNTVGIICREG